MRTCSGRPATTPGVTPPSAITIIALFAVLVLFPRIGNAQLDKPLADSLRDVFTGNAMPAPQFDSTATLTDYLTYAAIASPALQRAFYQWEAALARTGYAGAWSDPLLSYSRFIESVETRVGPQNQKIGVKQTIPWPGLTGAKKSVAAEDANRAYRQFQAARLKLFNDVRSAYYDLYYLGRELDLTQQNLDLLTFWESVARARYKVALKQHPDIIKVQVELGKLEDRLLTLQDHVHPTQSRLRALLNLPDTVDLVLPDTLEVLEFSPDHEATMMAVLANNPDLQSMAHIVESRRAGTRLAALKARPSFTFGVDYIETGPAVNPALPESGKDPWAVGVSINLPLWLGKNSARTRESHAKLRAAELSYRDAQNQLNALVDMVLFQYEDALRKLRLYRDGLIPKAEQALQASFTAYQAGETDFLNLLDAQRQLLAFQLEFEQAQTSFVKLHSELEVLIGGNLEDLNQSNQTEGAR